jgi:hypothetical protein
MSSIDRRSRASAIAGICIVATLVLGACSGTTGSSTEQGGVSAGADKAAAPQPAQDGSAVKAPAATPGDTHKLARTAQLRLGVTDLTVSAAAVRGVALGVGGTVTAENVNLSPPESDGRQSVRTTSGSDAPAGATPTASTVAPLPRAAAPSPLRFRQPSSTRRSTSWAGWAPSSSAPPPART